MNTPAPEVPIGTMVHHSDYLGAACRAAILTGYNEYGSADLAILTQSGIEFKPAWFGETSNDHGWHLIH